MFARKAIYSIDIDGDQQHIEAGFGLADRPYLKVNYEKISIKIGSNDITLSGKTLRVDFKTGFGPKYGVDVFLDDELLTADSKSDDILSAATIPDKTIGSFIWLFIGVAGWIIFKAWLGDEL